MNDGEKRDLMAIVLVGGTILLLLMRLAYYVTLHYGLPHL